MEPVKTGSRIRLLDSYIEFLAFSCGFWPEMIRFLRVFPGNSWNTASGIIVLQKRTTEPTVLKIRTDIQQSKDKLVVNRKKRTTIRAIRISSEHVLLPKEALHQPIPTIPMTPDIPTTAKATKDVNAPFPLSDNFKLTSLHDNDNHVYDTCRLNHTVHHNIHFTPRISSNRCRQHNADNRLRHLPFTRDLNFHVIHQSPSSFQRRLSSIQHTDRDSLHFTMFLNRDYQHYSYHPSLISD